MASLTHSMPGLLKKLFGRARKPAERSIYFHEDDYCQIELLPLAARQHCVTQMGIIDDFSARHSDGGPGYTDIYVRPGAPQPFAGLGISIAALSAAIQPHLPVYDSVFTGYSSYREHCKSTSAWGDESFTLFADHEAEIVRHVWLDFDNAFEPARVAAALRSVPGSDGLLIADWSWSRIALLSDAAALYGYFLQRLTGSQMDFTPASATLAEMLATIAAERDRKPGRRFVVVKRLLAEFGEADLAERLYAAIPSDCPWEVVADLFSLLEWSTSDNGSALQRAAEGWLRTGDDLRRIRVALHLDVYPFLDRAEMEEVLQGVAVRYPAVAERCSELIESRRRLPE